MAETFLTAVRLLVSFNLGEADLESKQNTRDICLHTSRRYCSLKKSLSQHYHRSLWVKYFSFQRVVPAAIGWSCNLTLEDSSSQPTSVTSTAGVRTSGPLTVFRPTQVYVPSSPWRCCWEGREPWCKTSARLPGQKPLTHTLPVCLSACLSLSHSHTIHKFVIWLGLIKLLLTSPLTCRKMLHLDDMSSLNWKSDHIGG